LRQVAVYVDEPRTGEEIEAEVTPGSASTKLILTLRSKATRMALADAFLDDINNVDEAALWVATVLAVRLDISLDNLVVKINIKETT
jgi:hypothetical protein